MMESNDIPLNRIWSYGIKHQEIHWYTDGMEWNSKESIDVPMMLSETLGNNKKSVIPMRYWISGMSIN